MVRYQYLNHEMMEQICHPMAVAYFDRTEIDHISPYPERDHGKLDAALMSPQQTFNQFDLYEHLEDKAAILWYSLIQNHPFPNGNKRIATASMLVFLSINNCWLYADQQEVADWAIYIAKSGENNPPEKIGDLLPKLSSWLKEKIQVYDN